MEGLATWELIGVIVGIAVGVSTILGLVFWAGIKIGRLVTRDDLNDTSDRLEKKIEDTGTGLEQQIDGTRTGLEKQIDGTRTGLEKQIDGTGTGLEKTIDNTRTDLEKKIDDNARRTDERFDEILIAIRDLGIRLETAIMDHTHDEDGVAVFRRHPQMADVGD